MDGANVRVVECRCSASFTPETFQSLRITGNVVGQELQGDEAAKLGVLGLVDHTHSAATQLLDDAVVRNGLAQQEKRRAPTLGKNLRVQAGASQTTGLRR